MADRFTSLDDILATSASPTVTPTPTITPTPEPSFLSTTGSSLVKGLGRGISDLGSLVSLPFQYDKIPGLIKSAAQYAYEDPAGAALSTIRGVGRAGTQAAFGAAGGVLGTAGGAAAGSASPLLPGVGTVVGGGIGGLTGIGLGTSVGDIAYNKLENATVEGINDVRSFFGYEPYQLPHKDLSPLETYKKLVEDTAAGATGEALFRGGGALIKALKPAALVSKNIVHEATQELMPLAKGEITTDSQKGAIGDMLVQAGVTKPELEAAVARKEAALQPNAANPFDANKTTGELLDNRKLIVAQDYAAASPAGQIPFHDMSQAQIKAVDDYVGNMMTSPDPNNRALGMQVKKIYADAKNAAWQQVDALYKTLYKTSGKEKFTTTEIANDLGKVADTYLPEGYAKKTILDKIIKNLSPAEEVVARGKGVKLVRQVENKYDINNLVAASSRLKAEARKLKAEGAFDREWGAFEEASKVIDNFIESDPRFGDHFKEANKARAAFAQKFEKGQISNLDKEFSIAPENVGATLSGTSDEWVQSLKVLGNNPAATKAILTQKLDDFQKLSTVDAKLKWLDDNIELFNSTNKYAEVNKMRTQLKGLQEYLTKAEKQKEILPNVDLNGIGIGDIQKAAIAGKTAALGEGDKSLLQALRQVSRDKPRQVASGLTRTAVGLSSPALSLGAALVGFGVSKFSRDKMVRGVEQLNSMMVRALTDPKYALEMYDYAGKLASQRAVRAARGAKASAQISDIMAGFGGGTAAQRQSYTNYGTGRNVLARALQSQEQVQTPASDVFSPFTSVAGSQLQSTATPTATPTASLSGQAKYGSVDDILNAVATPAPTPKTKGSPDIKETAAKYTGIINQAANKYGVDPSILHAVAEQESKFRPKAVGPKTRFGQAKGMFQIMDGTAKGLKIKDRFDVSQSAEGAAQLIADHERRFGDIKLALAAYNWRPAALNNQIKILQAKGIDPTWENLVAYGDIPTQTENYVPAVLKRRQKYIG